MLAKLRGNKRVARLGVVGLLLFALSAPALAEHFDWNAFLTGEPDPSVQVTAADVHIECPEPEGATTTVTDESVTPTVVDCDKAVQEAATELQSYDHPENHGKYVSFLAHCLKGMKGKGSSMRQIAQADEDSQQELAVKLCAEWKIEQASQDEADVDADSGKSKSKSKSKSKDKDDDDDAEDAEDDAEDDDDDDDDDEADEDDDDDDRSKNKSKRSGKGKGRRR